MGLWMKEKWQWLLKCKSMLIFFFLHVCTRQTINFMRNMASEDDITALILPTWFTFKTQTTFLNAVQTSYVLRDIIRTVHAYTCSMASPKLLTKIFSLQETAEGPRWHNQDSPYTCSVSSPKKESKMKGLKSFIAYQLTPTVSFWGVSQVCLVLLGKPNSATSNLMKVASTV